MIWKFKGHNDIAGIIINVAKSEYISVDMNDNEDLSLVNTALKRMGALGLFNNNGNSYQETIDCIDSRRRW